MIFKFLILIILILINGIFSATEIAYLSISKYELNKELKKNNKKAEKIVNLLNDSSSFLSAIQIAITLSGFLASAFAAESFASELASIINISFISTSTLTTILVVLITIILSYFTLVLGELVPKKIGLAYSKEISFAMVNVIDFVIKFFKPFIFILKSSTDFIVKILKIKKIEETNEDELKNNIAESGLEDLEKGLLFNVFEFNDTTVEKVMTPKKDVIFIDLEDSRDKIIGILKKYKYTRFPVTHNKKVIGVINVKDFILKHNNEFSLKNYVRDLTKVKYDDIIDDAFLLFNGQHEAMAQVMKDGKFIGIITMEDIIEEIVGNVFDEYDSEDKK